MFRKMSLETREYIKVGLTSVIGVTLGYITLLCVIWLVRLV